MLYYYRIIYNFLILIALFWLSFWFFLILIFLGLMIYKKFYEAFIWAILADVIFSTSQSIFLNFEYIYTLITIILFLIINFLHKKIRYV